MITTKILFLTENNFDGYVPRDYRNARTEFSWMIALKAEHNNIYNYFNSIQSNIKKYDIAMVIVPKYNFDMQLLLLENFDIFKKRFKKIVWVQEGPSDLIHDLDIKHQFYYLEILKKFDLLLCHSWKDIDYFKFLSEGKKTETIPTLMITDLVENLHKAKTLNKDKKIKVIVSGNIGNWYHAIDSYIIVKQLSKQYDIDAYCVSMGRKYPSEKFFTNYKYLPYVDWFNWMKLLRGMDIGINMTRRTAANTFNLNCMYMGIPVLRRSDLESNNSFEITYYTTFEKVFNNIIENYDEISKEKIQNYDLFYSEEHFLRHMNEVFSNLLKK